MDARRIEPSGEAERDGGTDDPGATRALVIVGHGSHLNPDSSAPVYEHAARFRERGAFAEVREAFWKEEPSLREALRTVAAPEVVVVPMFVSEGYFTERVLPRELRLRDSHPLDVEKAVWYAQPVGTHEAMTDVIVRRAERITDDPAVGPGVGLAVIGHGTERNPTSARAIREHAERLRERDRFEDVRAMFMDQAPFVEETTDHLDCEAIVAVPLFVADGFHTREEIPELLGLAGEYPDYENPSAVDGRRIWYAGAVGTEPAVASAIEQRAGEALGDPPAADGRSPGYPGRASTEGETTAARRAFLRWLDAGERDENGVIRRWGELAIVVNDERNGEIPLEDEGTVEERVGDDRTYEIRHRADAGVNRSTLERHADPAAARAIVRFDDDGTYRPLKTAPTLPRGWTIAGLDGPALHRAIGYVYPATIVNWHRERGGDLDVTHYEETAARQTGIYDVAEELNGADLDRATRACCDDSQCCKRRVWERNDEAVLDAPNGDGAFPCREPCSLFVAAAREFALEERETTESRTDSSDNIDRPTEHGSSALTATERDQLDAILEAAAKGDLAVRDGAVDEPTNRFRIRYLREKLCERADGGNRASEPKPEASLGGGD